MWYNNKIPSYYRIKTSEDQVKFINKYQEKSRTNFTVSSVMNTLLDEKHLEIKKRQKLNYRYLGQIHEIMSKSTCSGIDMWVSINVPIGSVNAMSTILARLRFTVVDLDGTVWSGDTWDAVAGELVNTIDASAVVFTGLFVLSISH